MQACTDDAYSTFAGWGDDEAGKSVASVNDGVGRSAPIRRRGLVVGQWLVGINHEAADAGRWMAGQQPAHCDVFRRRSRSRSRNRSRRRAQLSGPGPRYIQRRDVWQAV